MRSRAPLFVFLLIAGSFVLPVVAHAAIPFFGPIIPPQSITGVQGSDVCAAGWGMLIMVINNIISFLLTLVIVFVAPLMIAYSGFLFVVNPVNSGGIAKAKSVLLNTIIGIVIAFAGWLVVDAIMAVLYHPTDASLAGKAWSQLITSGDLSKTTCIPLKESLSQSALQNTSGVSTGGLNSPSWTRIGTACDPAVVKAAAAAGGYTLTNVQANTFACIAKPESNCGAPQDPPNYNWNSAKSSPGSTAAGAFQVLLSSHADCYENSVCRSAAGVSSSLNCASGFSRGNPIPSKSAVVDQCLRAANDLDCSTSAAACVLQQAGGSFRDWQADVNSAVQTGCINTGNTGT
ncbi:MAG: pilin [Candidatus Paceibacterota bacterium]|jgi:hypothetical protein